MRGLATYYVLFFLHLETRRVTVAGITQHPTEEWMVQMARNAVDVIDGTLLRFAMPYMIATRSSAVPFKLCFGLTELSRYDCHRAARI